MRIRMTFCGTLQVDWYPWGEEAFEKARRDDKPVFLSVGYSTCHWYAQRCSCVKKDLYTTRWPCKYSTETGRLTTIFLQERSCRISCCSHILLAIV